MRWILIILLLFTYVNADEDTQEHEFFITAYMYSAHFSDNDETDEKYNETHKAYGLEYINQDEYSITYNNFINSRGNEVDVYGLGYLFHLNDNFGLHLIGGYQEGYCFNGVLSSTECTEGKDNTSAFILPLLYYKHKYFKVDFFTNSDMVALRFNIKIY